MTNVSWKHIPRSALLAVALCALPVQAGPDNVGLGTGRDGELTVTALNTVINSYAQVTAPLAPGDTTLTVSSSTGFTASKLVLVHQTTGIVPTPPTGGTGPIDLTNDPVGRWEFARLSGVTGTTLTLTAPLLYSYAASVTQVISVPEYTHLTVDAAGSLTAQAWNGTTGGVLIFLAAGTVQLEGELNVDGKGLRGGLYVQDTLTTRTGCSGVDEAALGGAQKGEGLAVTRYGTGNTGRGHVANGGGGGVCARAGGGGGGNGGAGGVGGNTDSSLDPMTGRPVGGTGGVALTYPSVSRLTLGGGGGAGHGTTTGTRRGGAGGGIIFVRADALQGDGSINASGAQGDTVTGLSAAHGGGAGGTVYLRLRTSADCAALVQGGSGGNTNASMRFVGPGGGGGGGRALLQAVSGSCTIDTAGGNPGQTATLPPSGDWGYGAQGGANGVFVQLPEGFPVLAAPVVVTPANGSSTHDTTPTYSGTLPPPIPAGTTVSVIVDGGVVGTATPDAAGNWSFTPTTPLAPGSHTANALAINLAEAVESIPSPPHTFTVATTPPVAPVVNTPANGSRTNDNTPTYTGTAELGSTVTVIVNSSPMGTTPADAAGNWVFTPTPPLAEGSHTVSATATDAAGNVSPMSNTNAFTIDITTPEAPVVVTPANGSRTEDSTPTYAGTAEPGSTVIIIVDGPPVGIATADVAGNWAFTPTPPLAEGSHTVKATATDAAGNVSPVSNTNTFMVDATPPTVVVTTPAEGSITHDNTPTYSGTVEAGSTVTLSMDGTVVGTATVTGTTWTFTQTPPLPDGPHTVTASATNAAGTATDSTTFTVDTASPAVAVTAPAEGSSTHDTTPTYSGLVSDNGPGPYMVLVTVDGTPLGNAAVTDGTWTFDPAVPLADGPHTVTATATDLAGNTAADSNIFTVDTFAPAVSVTTPADGSTTHDSTPLYAGTVEAGATVVISVDGTEAGPALVTDTAWTFTQLTALSEGSHTVTATATDPGGNTATDSNSFTVDLTPPTVTVTTPGEGSGTNDPTLVYSGTVEAGAAVIISVDGTVVGDATVMGTRWTFTPSTPLSEGSHTVTALAMDAAGNTASDSNDFTVDLTAPAAAMVGMPANGSTITDSTLTFSGMAEPGSTLTLIVDGTVVTTSSVEPSGSWSFTPLIDLSNGSHTVTTTVTDAAGNTSPHSDTTTFIVELNQATGGWRAIGTLLTARTGHKATVLPSGKVLVIGGEGLRSDGTRGPLASTEVYDPATGTWSPTGALTTARQNHLVTTLLSGQVLVTGGEGIRSDGSRGPLASTEVYDPATGIWSPTGALTTARQNHSAVLLPSGQVLVTGGEGIDSEGTLGPLASTEVYDPATGTWSPTGALTTARQSHSATVLFSGQVLVTGGEGIDSEGTLGPLASTEVYDPATKTWSSTGALATARRNHSATMLLSGEVLVAGGEGLRSNGTRVLLASTEVYDPATKTWSPTGALVTARRNHSAVQLPSGRVLISGSEGPSGALTSTEVYAPGTGVWSPTRDLLTARSGHAVTLLPSGHVIITGGQASGRPLGSVEVYKTVGASSPTAPLTEARSGFSTVLLPNGQVLVVGGSDSDGRPLASARLYNPFTGQWSEAANMGMPRASATATLLRTGQVLVTGGRAVAHRGLQGPSADGGEVLSTAELFDPVTNTWRSTGSLQEARYAHSAILLSTGNVLVTGGLDANDTLCTTAEVYDVAAGAWSKTDSMNFPRRQHMVAQLPTGEVLAAGGRDSHDIPLASAEVYHPVQKTWTNTASMSTARATSTAALLPTGQVLVVGGANDSGTLSTAEVYDPTGRKWIRASSLNAPRKSHTALLLPTGRVLILGGSDDRHFLDDVEVYDTKQNTWETLSRLVDARENSMTLLLPSGKVLVLGGQNAMGPLANSELYDEFGAPDSRRPVVEQPSPQKPDAHFRVKGQGFTDPTGDSSRVRMQLAPLGALRDVSATGFSDTSVQVTLPGVPEGFHLLFVMVHDVAGGQVLPVDATPPAAPSVKGWTHGAQPQLSGTAEPYSTVQVSLNGSPQEGSAEANASGAWSLSLTTLLVDGSYQVSATALDAAGNLSQPSVPITLIVDTEAPPPPEVSSPGALIKNPKPTLGGTAEAHSTVTVSLDGHLLGRAMTDSEERWSLPLQTVLEDGVHTVSATATDPHENTSRDSAKVTFTVDTQAPAAPEVLTPQEGTTMSSRTVTASGTAEADSTVTVSVEGAEKGTAKAHPSTGAWSLTFELGPENGGRTLVVTATDAALNVSPPAKRTFAVDTGGGCSGCASSPREPSLVLLGLAALWRLLSRRRSTRACASRPP
ncbi:adventurous gliding motility protein AgmC [Hyalangium minutum]|uniref:Large repetitive protein n=1 Tax=Hyalangium minutum TaxID=394096 RepID=A0A085W9E4_9BACT|nr:Ig-like domain repeat protein [Hyalangium minutum]KFE64307.1 Large repetitive protein [Hyalangium minutum]